MPLYFYMIVFLLLLFFSKRIINWLRQWETKAVGSGNISVEGHTPAAFQSHVQTKRLFTNPRLFPPVSRVRIVLQPGLEEAACSFLGSWGTQWTTTVWQLRHSLSWHAAPNLQLSLPSETCGDENLERNSWSTSIALPLPFTGEPVTIGVKRTPPVSHSV